MLLGLLHSGHIVPLSFVRTADSRLCLSVKTPAQSICMPPVAVNHEGAPQWAHVMDLVSDMHDLDRDGFFNGPHLQPPHYSAVVVVGSQCLKADSPDIAALL